MVPECETFRFGPGAVKKSSRAVIFPVVVGQTVFLLRAGLLDEEVPLLVSLGVLKQLGSVIDVAEKTIEFETFQNAKVPLEVVAGHLTMDLQPKRASAPQKQLAPEMREQVRQGQEATILRPSSENVVLVWPYHQSHHVATTAKPQEDSDSHQTDTAHGQTNGSSGDFQDSSLPNHWTYRVYWRSRAGEMFPGPRQRRRPLDALAHRMRHEARGQVRRVEVSKQAADRLLWPQ